MNFDENAISIILSSIRQAGNISIDARLNNLVIDKKSDGSFVTNADKIVSNHLINMIRNDLKNNDIIISEEDEEIISNPKNIANKAFWSIDPIDATSVFIKNDSPFWTINLAYIVNNNPIFGVIYAPDLDKLWYGNTITQQAFLIHGDKKERIYTRKVPSENATIVAPDEQEIDKEILEKLNIRHAIRVSSSIKFCYIAQGDADYYIRKRNKACDWDIASGHALIVSAGGKVSFLAPHEDFLYGVPNYKAPSLLATGNTD